MKQTRFNSFRLLSLVFLALVCASPSLVSQQIFNGEHTLAFNSFDYQPEPVYIAFGEGQDATVNLNYAFLISGQGARFADSGGSAPGNTATINIDPNSQLFTSFDVDGLADIFGVDGNVVINVLTQEWDDPDVINLRTQRVSLAVEPGSSATVNLIGPHSTWDARIRHIDLGIGGTGTINVLQGARLFAAQRLAVGGTRWTATSGLLIDEETNEVIREPYAPEAGGEGLLLVDGAGSKVEFANSSNAWLRIGRRSTGTAIVSNGGEIDLADNTVESGVEIHVGDLEGGDGTLIIESGGTVRSNGVFRVNSQSSDRGYVRVDGAGSLLDIDLEGRTSMSFVGNTGTGEDNVGILEVINGGVANFSASLRFGNQADAVGELIVDGPGSELNVGTFLQAGWNGTGIWRVTNGGLLADHSVLSASSIGRQVGSNGTLIVDGVGSRATFAGPLWVATGSAAWDTPGTGTALAEISNGGLLEVGTVLPVRGNGTVVLDDGLIRMTGTEAMSVAGPNASLLGEGRIEGDLLVANEATLAGTGTGITVDGVLSGEGTVENFTLGGIEASTQMGRLTLRNVRFASGAVVTVVINDLSEVDGLIALDESTNLAGTALDISVQTFITDPDWAVRLFEPALPTGAYGFASITVPEGFAFADGVLSVAGETPPPPPPVVVSEWAPATTSVVWRDSDNWSAEGFPDDGLTVARFGSVYNDGATVGGVPTTTVTVHVANAGGTQNVGAVVLGSDNFVDRRVRANVANFRGAIALHGVPLDIEGKSFDSLLVGNFSQDNSLRFHSWAATQLFDVIFMRSGVIHVEEPDAMARFTSRIYEPEETSVSITKTGAGILNIGIDFGGEDPARVSITGDMILEEGILQNTYSGTAEDGAIVSSCYGFGNLVLRGGNVRSSSSTGRTIFNNVILDGTVAFGSPNPDFNGNQTVSITAAGATSLASDSTVFIHNTTTWAQAISGDFGLTKGGPGTLILSGAGGPLTHTGATAVEEGLLRVGAVLSSSPLTVEPGASLAFGTAGAPGQMITGGSVTLSPGSSIEFRMNEAGVHDSMALDGPLTLGGASLSLSLGYQPVTATPIVLIQNNGFEPVSGIFTYEGIPLPEGSSLIVTTGDFSQEFVITYQRNGNSVALLPVGEFPSTPFEDWAAGFGLTGDDALPGANPSGDGFSNAAKFAFGASPLMAVPALAEVEASAEGVTLRWNRLTAAGVSYRIERSPTLEPGSWEEVEGAVPALVADPGAEVPEGYERVEWTAVPAEGRAFYRVVSVLEPSLLP